MSYNFRLKSNVNVTSYFSARERIKDQVQGEKHVQFNSLTVYPRAKTGPGSWGIPLLREEYRPSAYRTIASIVAV